MSFSGTTCKWVNILLSVAGALWVVQTVLPSGLNAQTPSNTTDQSMTTPGSDPFADKYNVNLQIGQVQSIAAPMLTKDDRVPISLSLQNCITRALANNLDIRVERLNPSIRLNEVVEAEAVFDAVLFGSAQFNFNDAANIDSAYFTRTITTAAGTKTVQIPTTPFLQTRDYSYAAGLKKLLPTGASVRLAQQLRRFRDLNDRDQLYYDPFYEFGLQFQIQQPLLRDFGLDVNRASILASKNNYRISQQQFHLRIIDTLTQIETAYWQLFFARTRVKVFDDQFNRVRESYQRILQRQPYDTRSQALSRAEAVVRTAQANLIAAHNAVLQQQDVLLNRINDPQLSIKKKWEIILEDAPLQSPFQLDRQQAIAAALQLRPEIIAQKYRLDTAELAQGVAQNQTLPRMDLFYQQEITGAARDTQTSWDNQWDNQTSNYLVGLSFEIPVANRAALASLERAQSRKKQEQLQLQNLREQILADVNISLHDLENSYTEIQARFEAMQANKNEVLNYLAIQDKERQDSATPEFINLKLNADDRLAASQITAVQTLIEYTLSVMNIHRAQGNLLRYNNVKITELPLSDQ